MEDTIYIRTSEEEFKEISIEELVFEFDYEFDAQGLKTASREMRANKLKDLIMLAAQA
jgi:hypothetical protein